MSEDLEQSDPILLTPGPLTTSASVKRAMLHDMGSRDPAFIALNAAVLAGLLEIAEADEHYVCVPVQGSGTFAVEAMLGTLLPPTGHLLNLVNGAYGHRITSICKYLGRRVSALEWAEQETIDPDAVAARLREDPSISHVAMVHCETTTGILNPLGEIAKRCDEAGIPLLVDAMSSFGALPTPLPALKITALAASSNKCLQGAPGMGFCLIKDEQLRASAGNAHSLSLDLLSQQQGFQSNGQWRFTPPTHVLLALDAALRELAIEGGREARLRRYQENCDRLLSGMKARGFEPLLEPTAQAPIIITFKMPADTDFDFDHYYTELAKRGFVIYPGKLTRTPSFRVGCIGAIDTSHIQSFLAAVDEVQATPLN